MRLYPLLGRVLVGFIIGVGVSAVLYRAQEPTRPPTAQFVDGGFGGHMPPPAPSCNYNGICEPGESASCPDCSAPSQSSGGSSSGSFGPTDTGGTTGGATGGTVADAGGDNPTEEDSSSSADPCAEPPPPFICVPKCCPGGPWICSDKECPVAPSSSSSSRGRGLCGNRIIESPEQCDNGRVCTVDSTLRCATDADCYQHLQCQPGIPGCALNAYCCQGTKDVCVEDADCEEEYIGPCRWSETPNATCTEQCKIAASSMSSQPGASSSSGAILSAASQSSSERPAQCGNGVIEGDEECDAGGQCNNRYGICASDAECAPVRGVCVDAFCRSLDPSVDLRACRTHEDCWGLHGVCRINYDPRCTAKCVLASSALDSAYFEATEHERPAAPFAICSGYECRLGGESFCRDREETCNIVEEFPCIRCMSDSLFSQPPPAAMMMGPTSALQQHRAAPQEATGLLAVSLMAIGTVAGYAWMRRRP